MMKSNIEQVQTVENLKNKFIHDASHDGIEIDFLRFLECEETFDFILSIDQNLPNDFWCKSNADRNQYLKTNLNMVIEELNFCVDSEAYASFIAEDCYTIMYEIEPYRLANIINKENVIGYNIQQQDIWDYAIRTPLTQFKKSTNGKWLNK